MYINSFALFIVPFRHFCHHFERGFLRTVHSFGAAAAPGKGCACSGAELWAVWAPRWVGAEGRAAASPCLGCRGTPGFSAGDAKPTGHGQTIVSYPRAEQFGEDLMLHQNRK